MIIQLYVTRHYGKLPWHINQRAHSGIYYVRSNLRGLMMLSMLVGFLLTLFYSRSTPFTAMIDLSTPIRGWPSPFQPNSVRGGTSQSTTNQSMNITGSNYNISGSPCTWMANDQCLVCAAYYDNRTGLSITPSVTAVGYRFWRSEQKFQCH